ncbi:MAG: hypothetical protein SPI06_06030 [Terrisporobacter sp.]|uniref:hypothetical protein n=1 Tax=Terrisporobacter sp. TaxID=1965305 RepID=UPI002A916827|nr:hypothetical protein [Terrisporobacter sp.]MDY6152952.1 hypothetical protein [Terrisporobacter sp.]
MRLEQIKLRMEENLKELREYQEMQLRSYEYLMSLTDIDEIDMEIQCIEDEFKFTTLFKDIAIKEKENLDNLISSVWEAKNKGVEANV